MNSMPPPAIITEETFCAYLKCKHKAYLKLQGAVGEVPEYERLLTRIEIEYRKAARRELLRTQAKAAFAENPPSLPDAIQSGKELILNATVNSDEASCHLDALYRTGNIDAAVPWVYSPILFTPHERVAAEDRLRLAFAASVLSRIQGTEPESGRIIHGPNFKASRVALPTLVATVRSAVGQIQTIQQSVTPPPLVLNRHCPACEFRGSCRAMAVDKDDLSLLRGLNAKEIAGLNQRGIFTVTQYSHTFRPARMKHIAEKTFRKHDASLQALAIREKKVYVAQRKPIPDGKVRIYLDVEALPDPDRYYLVGLLIVQSDSNRRMNSFWADRATDEPAIWAAFLRAIAEAGEDFVIFHYGSYESRFLQRMAKLHGGDPALIQRIESRTVNVLSLIYGRVFFPTYANDLKSIAGFLGFKWSSPDASGLQSMVWRTKWEATRCEDVKQLLVTYNHEDCSALETVVGAIRVLTGETPASGSCLSSADVKDIKTPRHHKFCDPEYVLPEFARITKCAYFDYQRDRVLFRTSPAVKQANRRKKRALYPTCRVNRVVEFAPPICCPRCGSEELFSRGLNERLVVDLKPTRGGLKRWVTRYKAKLSLCRRCAHRFLPDDFVAVRGRKYGWALCGWAVYASVALRQVSRDTAASMDDMFGVPIRSGGVGRLRDQVSERYRETYKSLLADLRRGPLVHADETWVRVKGREGKGYVWVFANPEVAVYLYSPSREGNIVRDALSEFRGVLVSDFYAAYDTLDCPQQKCLVHLVRDLNDDLSKNPFDEELKNVAGRFASLMQSVVETIDRYGLKKFHLGKHKPDVDNYFNRMSAAPCESELARYYQHRFLKYRNKLFTFLDYDGVPWNNNNAENAVKRFVTRRKGMGGTAAFSEKGIRDYLVLLSIYQTLRFRQLNFWQFLLSGETDIAAFTTKHG
jgi:predicted RecB family nuclease